MMDLLSADVAELLLDAHRTSPFVGNGVLRGGERDISIIYVHHFRFVQTHPGN